MTIHIRPWHHFHISVFGHSELVPDHMMSLNINCHCVTDLESESRDQLLKHTCYMT